MSLAAADPFPGEDGSVAEVLLRVHRSYLKVMRPLLGRVHAMAHITGGGIPGNLNRVMPGNLSALVEKRSWTPPNVFRVMQSGGGLEEGAMFSTFNMGVGMVVVCSETDSEAVIASAAVHDVPAWRAGRVSAGDGSVVLV
jgi:phosphoribosylformylglycinamidine cyclo-ligase